jgi:undecaprenyl-diphosphatase
MTTFEAVVLGIIQGITEFLPVSSSGHLVLAREVFGFSDVGGLGVDAVLQLASGLAVLIYFRKDLFSMATSVCSAFTKKCSPFTIEGGVLGSAIAFATIPVVLAGMYVEPLMEEAFRSVGIVAGALAAGSILMIWAERSWKKRISRDFGFAPLSVSRGFFIGLFQVLALIPGFSRSGATISGALLFGLSREQAGRYSFLLAIPLICGAGIKKLLDGGVVISGPLIIGTIVSFVVSMWAIAFLLNYIKHNSLLPFVGYRLGLAALLLFFL